MLRPNLMRPDKCRCLQLASSVFLEDVAVEARTPGIQNHIRVNLPMRMVPLLHGQLHNISAWSRCNHGGCLKRMSPQSLSNETLRNKSLEQDNTNLFLI